MWPIESFAGSGLYMLPLVEEACLVEAFVNQIIQGLRGEQPMNNDIEVDEQLVNNEKMASYSQVVSGNNRQGINQDTG